MGGYGGVKRKGGRGGEDGGGVGGGGGESCEGVRSAEQGIRVGRG